MKTTIKSTTTLLFISFLLNISCKKDDPSPAANFVGKWRVVKIEYSGCTEASDNRVIDCVNGTVKYASCVDFEFKANNEYTIYYTGSAPYDGQYAVVGNKLIYYVSEYYFNFSGNTVALTRTEATARGCTEVTTLMRI